MVEPGTLAPDFTLPADGGGEVTLSDFRGKRVVLYFYPKDDTPGCTKQACDLRDSSAAFEEADVVILGISGDSVSSHDAFREKYRLNFPLLADENHEVSIAYGVWKKHRLFGMNIERSTFVIGPDGVVLEAWRKVKPGSHADMVAAHLGL